MTGFGAALVSEADLSVRVEVRSVNHRHLQVKTRLPNEHAQLENDVESAVRGRLERGAVTVSINLERTRRGAPAVIDGAVAARYKAEIEKLARELSLDPDISIETLLALPGVISAAEDDSGREHEAKLIMKALARAIDELVAMREREGASLLADLQKNSGLIAKVQAKLEKRMPKALAEHHKNLHERVEELLGSGVRKGAQGRAVSLEGVDLARELALLADKMDVSEEFTRLTSHLSQLEKMLAGSKPVGRQLDFLVQEFLREANTIGSKCNDAEAAHAVVELKTLIERLREQVQNVE
ncbi:MAG: YicC family protein [Planctomycetes bacterium]|nr:YicC family protein [Planctomycetota bacterium]